MKDHWEVKEVLDRTTGKVERFYTYKRKSCKRIVLDSRLARQLAGYALIEKDLRNVLSWLDEIKSRHSNAPKRKDERFGHSDDRETYTLIKGLFVAALTFYGKCFAQCDGRRASSRGPSLRNITGRPMTKLSNIAITLLLTVGQQS